MIRVQMLMAVASFGTFLVGCQNSGTNNSHPTTPSPYAYRGVPINGNRQLPPAINPNNVNNAYDPTLNSGSASGSSNTIPTRTVRGTTDTTNSSGTASGGTAGSTGNTSDSSYNPIPMSTWNDAFSSVPLGPPDYAPRYTPPASSTSAGSVPSSIAAAPSSGSSVTAAPGSINNPNGNVTVVNNGAPGQPGTATGGGVAGLGGAGGVATITTGDGSQPTGGATPTTGAAAATTTAGSDLPTSVAGAGSQTPPAGTGDQTGSQTPGPVGPTTQIQFPKLSAVGDIFQFGKDWAPGLRHAPLDTPILTDLMNDKSAAPFEFFVDSRADDVMKDLKSLRDAQDASLKDGNKAFALGISDIRLSHDKNKNFTLNLSVSEGTSASIVGLSGTDNGVGVVQMSPASAPGSSYSYSATVVCMDRASSKWSCETAELHLKQTKGSETPADQPTVNTAFAVHRHGGVVLVLGRAPGKNANKDHQALYTYLSQSIGNACVSENLGDSVCHTTKSQTGGAQKMHMSAWAVVDGGSHYEIVLNDGEKNSVTLSGVAAVFKNVDPAKPDSNSPNVQKDLDADLKDKSASHSWVAGTKVVLHQTDGGGDFNFAFSFTGSQQEKLRLSVSSNFNATDIPLAPAQDGAPGQQAAPVPPPASAAPTSSTLTPPAAIAADTTLLQPTAVKASNAGQPGAGVAGAPGGAGGQGGTPGVTPTNGAAGPSISGGIGGAGGQAGASN